MARLLGTVILLLPISVWATGTLDQINLQFQQSSSSWMNQSIIYANHLFAGLALIEFVWSGIHYLLRKNELTDLLSALTFKILSLSFFYSLISLAPQWIPLIISSFSQAGATISGVGTLSPSNIFNLGPQIANQLILSLGSPSMGLQALGSYLFSAICAGLSSLLIVIAFAFASLQLLITLIESYLIIGGGMIMLGFLGSRWTISFGERYLGYAVSVGIKLFVLYLIVGLGPLLAQNINQDIQQAMIAAGTGSPPPASFFTAAAISLVFGALCFMIPSLAATMMSGSPSLSLSNVGNSAVFSAGTALGIGATGLGLGVKLANQTIGAAKAIGSGITLAKQQGIVKASQHGLNSVGSMVKDHLTGHSAVNNQTIMNTLQEKQVQGLGKNTLGAELANRIRLTDKNTSQLSINSQSPVPQSSNTISSIIDHVAEQQLKSSTPHDGSTGSVSIRINHID
ncbi:MAG: P-type conjugative transfer protein TrbL [Betaproteobacteria bacterium]|nr:P-type conjugative transfer protein TrbL [Betaproteobacteria bacterium]MDE2056458.1 P-type conjugative transfer protein TrbL [Betaproteobacteria bacterium]